LRCFGAPEIGGFDFGIMCEIGSAVFAHESAGIDHITAVGDRQRQHSHLVHQQNRDALVAQVGGAFAGAASAHLMFGEAVFSVSHHARDGLGQIFSEFIATFGLLSVIWGCSRARPQTTPFAVGAYISAAYWFTASTSFANPAVTLARAASDTFAGIRPADAPGFIAAQVCGAAAATSVFRWLVPTLSRDADRVVVQTEHSEKSDEDSPVRLHPQRR